MWAFLVFVACFSKPFHLGLHDSDMTDVIAVKCQQPKAIVLINAKYVLFIPTLCLFAVSRIMQSDRLFLWLTVHCIHMTYCQCLICKAAGGEHRITDYKWI